MKEGQILFAKERNPITDKGQNECYKDRETGTSRLPLEHHGASRRNPGHLCKWECEKRKGFRTDSL